MKLDQLKDIFNDNIIIFQDIKCKLINNKDDQLKNFKELKKIVGLVNVDWLKNDEFQIIVSKEVYINFKIVDKENIKDLSEYMSDEMTNLSELRLSISIGNAQEVEDGEVYLNIYFFKKKNENLLELESLNINDFEYKENKENKENQKIKINDFIIYPKDKDNDNYIVRNYYFLYTILYKDNKPNFILLGKNNTYIKFNIKTKKNKYTNIEEDYIDRSPIFNNNEIIINNNNVYIGYCNSKYNTQYGDKNVIVAIKRILNSEDSNYLKVWGEYISKEGDALLNHAREVGIINPSNISFSFSDSMYIVEITPEEEKKLKYLRTGDSLSSVLGGEVCYIKNQNMDWVKYQEENKSLEPNKKNKGYVIEKIEKNVIYIKTKGDKLKITNNQDAKNKIKFKLNIQGSKSQIKRRESAKESIQNRANPMSNLYDLLEGKISNTSVLNNDNSSQILTHYVKEKIFNNNDPTSIQLEAIKIAINTPDIAIIQGPPGTGKTTIITAILEALNENYDKTKNISGKILITSFQHDAVENIIQKLKINALPTIKFGSRNNSSDDNDFNMDKFIKKWGEDLIKDIENKNINVKSVEEIQKLKEIIDVYKNSPTLENENKFLYYSKNLMSRISSNQKLLNFIDYTIEYTNAELSANLSQSLLKQVLNLRVTKEGFLDDGAINAFKLYYTLKDDIFKNIKDKQIILNILKVAYNNYKDITIISDDDQDFKQILKKINQVRDTLLEILKPKPLYISPQINQDILKLYDMIEKELKLLEKSPKDLIIYEYTESLKTNPNLINSALKEYTTVFGSTIQQTLSKKICDIKIPKDTLIKKNNIPIYDTVIIDEAARANPGDLMIALMQAKNKIILVGDHRQLPHMYDEDILDEIVSDDEIKHSITESLFERLIKIVKELEKKDYNKRFITLDTQYRMPKTLGNFVSDNFYKKNGEAFKSELGDENFIKYLDLMPSFANWIDVPNYENRDTSERKLGGSYQRKQEVDAIIEKIQELISTEIGENLTYGIISFYKAQVIEIKKCLPDELKNKVRVGSVDAFQGLEFDVIFLSTVRTSESLGLYPEEKKEIEAEEKTPEEKELSLNNLKKTYAKKTFGFLLMENRLCVAMSRQKKILIAVGDLKLFESEFSKEFVPAMYSFYKLCKETGGIIY